MCFNEHGTANSHIRLDSAVKYKNKKERNTDDK